MSLRKILLTGFEPFGDVKINSSQQVVEMARKELSVPGAEIVCEVLPVVFDVATGAIVELLEQHMPDIAVSMGVAPKRACVCPEQFALNWAAPSIPDNEGHMPQPGELIPGGAIGYWSVFKGETALIEKMEYADITAALSITAGSFVCNAVMYHALKYIDERNLKTKFGFIHIPQSPEQGAAPGSSQKITTVTMTARTSFKALKLALDYLISD